MNTDHSPEQPQHRRFELIPLDGLDTPAEAPVSRPLPRPNANPVEGLPAARGYPHLVVEPIPIWQAPAVRTTRHPAAVLARRPEERPGAPTSTTGAAVPMAIRLGATPTDSHRERLRMLLERERESLTVDSKAATAPRVDEAPFPLPSTSVAGPGLRRAPKPVRADGAGRPLAADVAAAIARVTGYVPPMSPTAPGHVATSARDRMVFVPLDGPTPNPASFLPPPPPPPPIDLRDAKPSRKGTGVAHPCPACTAPGVVDVIDHITGDVHISCPACFRMWNMKITAEGSFDTR